MRIVIAIAAICLATGITGIAHAHAAVTPQYPCAAGRVTNVQNIGGGSDTSWWTKNPHLKCQQRPEILCHPRPPAPNKYPKGRWTRKLLVKSNDACPIGYALNKIWIQWRTGPGAHIGHKLIWSI